MRLKEFDLDAPRLPRLERKAFRDASRSVTALYERCFDGLNVSRGWKVLVECVPDVDDRRVRDLLGVLTVQVAFDVREPAHRESPGKEALFLDALYDGVVAVAQAEHWPIEPFEKARECVIGKNFVNQWWWRKPKWNRSRSMYGQLWCEHESDAFRAWLVVRDKKGDEVGRSMVLEASPSEFEFVAKLGDAKWTSVFRFALFAKDRSEVGAIELD